MAMFLQIIGHNKRLRVVKRRFQHSSQTVHVYFHEVLSAMMNMAMDIIVPTTFDPNSNISTSFRRLHRIFKGAVGALDGTLVHVVVPVSKQTMYRGRGKGWEGVNIIFVMQHTYIERYWLGDYRRRRALTKEEKFNHAHAQLRNLDQPNMPFDGANEDGQDHENDGTTIGPWWGVEDMQYMANVRDEIATRLMH
ncbi:PREDICTED: uncharacterized protein LOC105950131 [Erythranthe guttata]|uniref:uncharacterized protein LOC105950131 n=1 Tax=Erythranthe guttata TaxID=4155 RepID=UPI00064DC9CE|nr:PREDICTED: uncharacterized protein LOC105950131 [Erythranthe guttata]|eukprot:XP_012828902.1 PREDICTED: uncharacterized protein LOC105950131 [Erythranthe guttata]